MNETEQLPDLARTVRVDRHRRDPLKGLLLAASFTLACFAGCWAIWTHREWIRALDAAIVVLAVAEFGRVLWFMPGD